MYARTDEIQEVKRNRTHDPRRLRTQRVVSIKFEINTVRGNRCPGVVLHCVRVCRYCCCWSCVRRLKF